MAAGLLRTGIGAGQSVALYLPNTLWHPIAFFAILRTGARVVHLSPLDPPRALARKMDDSGARTIVTTNLPSVLPNALTLLAEGAAERLIVGEDDAWGSNADARPIPDDPRILPAAALAADAPPAWPAIAPGDIAVLQYTGGTTGLPKAAMLSHANLTAAVSIYEVVECRHRPRPASRRAHHPGAAAVSHLCADRGDAARPRPWRRAAAAAALRRRGRAARHRGRSTRSISPACRRCGSRW